MFDFDSKQEPQARMDELERFMGFWLRDRASEFQDSPPPKPPMSLPWPLQRIYSLAARWSRRRQASGEVSHPFCVQDCLRSPERLELTDDGKLIFIDENQGVWTNATLPQGDDPPVWVDEIFRPDCASRWRLVSESLSRFLISFCLQELLFGADFMESDDQFVRYFESDRCGPIVPILSKGPYCYAEDGHSFYLWRETVLVGRLHGLLFFGANHPRGVAFLEQSQSEIVRVTVGSLNGWSIDIQTDGSAAMRFFGQSASIASMPPSSFEFAEMRDRLLAATNLPGLSGDYTVYFFRRGRGHAEGLALRDTVLINNIFSRALAAVALKDERFDLVLRQHPPFR